MIHEYQLRILPEQAASEQSLKQYIGREKGLDVRTINAIRILKRSIDARQRTIYVNLTIRVFVNETPSEEEFVRTDYPNVEVVLQSLWWVQSWRIVCSPQAHRIRPSSYCGRTRKECT